MLTPAHQTPRQTAPAPRQATISRPGDLSPTGLDNRAPSGDNRPVDARRPRRILVTGDRYWHQHGVIHSALQTHTDPALDEGEAYGADSIARDEARKLGFTADRIMVRRARARGIEVSILAG